MDDYETAYNADSVLHYPGESEDKAFKKGYEQGYAKGLSDMQEEMLKLRDKVLIAKRNNAEAYSEGHDDGYKEGNKDARRIQDGILEVLMLIEDDYYIVDNLENLLDPDHLDEWKQKRGY